MENDVYEIPIEDDDLIDYFYETNYKVNDNDDMVLRKGMRELPKQLIATIEIIYHLFNNPGRRFSRSEFILGCAGDDIAFRDDDAFKLSVDSFKHALKFLKEALIITNVDGGKTTSEYSFNPHFEIYIPTSNENKASKAYMIATTMYNEVSLRTYKILQRTMKSDIFELQKTTFFGEDFTDDKIPICNPEIFPYWKEEMEVVKQGGFISKEEFNTLMYEKTVDGRYLTEMQKEAFVF